MKDRTHAAKRIISAILAVLMMISMFTVFTFAADTLDIEFVGEGVADVSGTYTDLGQGTVGSGDDVTRGTFVITLETGYSLSYNIYNLMLVDEVTNKVIDLTPTGTALEYTFEVATNDFDDLDLMLYVDTTAAAADEYELRYNVDGNLFAYERIKEGESTTIPTAVPTKEGYTFTGWDLDGTAYAAGDALANVATDLTFTAQFDPNTYTVTYYRGAEGDASDYKTILTYATGDVEMYDDDDVAGEITLDDNAYGTTVQLASAALVGYNFKGWKDEAGTIWSAGALYTVKGDVKLTAVWEEKTAADCLVIFQSDGAIYDAILAYEDQTIEIPATAPEKAGSTFNGWVYDGTTYDADNSSFEVVADANREMILVADWTENTYSVTYVDGETVSDLAYGEDFIIAAAPEKEGHTFVAWEDVSGAYYYANAAIKITADLTLKAVWVEDAAEEFVVKFYAPDGNLYDLYIVTNGDTIETPAYTAGSANDEYYWYDGVGSYIDVGVEVKIEADTEYFAKIKAQAEYAVNVHIVDDVVSDVTEFISGTPYTAGSTVAIALDIPEGFALKSVDAVADGNAVVDSLIYTDAGYVYYLTMPENEVDVYVEVEKVPVGSTVVKFMVDGALYDYITVTKGQNATAPDAPAKEGHTFVHWTDGNAYVKQGTFAVADDAADVMVFVAEFDTNEYLVQFDANGGTPNPPAQQVKYGSTVTLPSAPTKDGFTFIGWKDEATGFVYAEGGNFVVGAAANFIAVWEEIPADEFTVQFIDEESGLLYGNMVVVDGETVIAPKAPVVEGKTFVKWVSDDGTPVMAESETFGITKDTVFVAEYTINTHSIIPAGTNATVTVDGATTDVPVGTTVEFTAVADNNYDMVSVVLTYTDALGVATKVLPLNENNEYSFIMPDSDVTITAVATVNTFGIYAYEVGDVTITAPYEATAGDLVEFDVTADAGNVITSIAVISKGKVVQAIAAKDGHYYFTMPSDVVTIHAEAVKADYNVTYLDYDNTLLGIEAVKSGAVVVAAPVPEMDGYEFIGWEKLPELTTFDITSTKIEADTVLRAVYQGNAQTVVAGIKDNLHTLKAECTISTGNVNSSDLLQTGLNTQAGKTVYFTVAALYDYDITGVAVVSAEETDLVVEPVLREKKVEDNIIYYTYAFTMPAENVAIDVYTAPKVYTVFVSEDIPAAGTYTVNGYYTNNLLVALGDEVKVEVDPETGYVVKNITATYIDEYGNTSTVDGTLDGNVFTFDMVAKDVTVTIEYEANAYGIDVKTSNAASYKPDTTNIPIVAIESLDDALTSKGLIVIDGVADEKYEFIAGHYYDIPGNGEAKVGTEVKFTVETFVGYELDTLTVTYADGTKTVPVTEKDGNYHFTMPADDVVITALYKESTYTVTKAQDAEAHGQVEMNGLIENRIAADYKDEVEITVVPDKGYYVESISYTLANDTVTDFSAASYTGTLLTDTADTEHAITFRMPASDVTVNVSYAPIDYTVKAEYDDAQTKVEFTTPENIGEQVSFTTEAIHGYYIDKVYVTNDTTGELVNIFTDTVSAKEIYGAEYKFTMPASSVTITVVSDKDVYSVIYTDAGGFIGGEDVEYLDEANVSEYIDDVVNAKAGHHFIGWKSEDVKTAVKETAPSITDADFIVVKDKTYISAVYAKDEIDVKFGATTNGTVTVNGNTAAYVLDTTVFGDTVTFTATPDKGYIVDTVSITSTDAEGYNLDIRYSEQDGTYTFVIPATYKASVHDVKAEDVIVEVTFKKDTFTLEKAADCEANGTVAINGKVTTQTAFAFEYDASVAITATPDDGYYVASIVAQNADGSKKYEVTSDMPANKVAGDALTLNFKMPASDLEYVVDYEKINNTITKVFDATQGTVATTPDAIAVVGDIVTIDITPEYGYDVKEVYVVGDLTGKHIALSKVTEDQYTFTMPAEDVTVTVIFVKEVYTVTYKDWNGNVLKVESVNFMEQAQVNDLANEIDNVKAGYHFIGWASEDVAPAVKETAPSNNESDFVITKDTTITAIYEIDAVDVDFKATENGTVTSEDKTAPAVISKQVGDTVNFTATPADGYVIDTVTVTTVDEGGDPLDVAYTVDGNTYTFTVPATYKADATALKAQDVVVAVTFEKAEFILSQAKESETDGKLAVNGVVTTQTSFGYDFEDEVVITATPNNGYYVASIKAVGGNYEYEVTGTKVTNVTAGDPLTLTFNMPENDVEFTVTYEKIDYTITTVADAVQGKVETTPADVTTIGELVVVAVTPEYGYHIDTVQVRGNITGKYVALEKDTDGKYHFEMPAEDVTVTALFAKNIYTVTFIDWNGDILAVENVAYLDAAKAPADPARVGYTFTSWDKEFSSVTENITVTAQYKIITSDITSASISFTGTEHGTVTVPTGTTADFGSVVTVVADPEDGWRFGTISVLAADGKYVPVSFVKEDADYVTTYSFVMPENAVTITVYFVEQASSTFTDVRTDAWYYDAIEFVTDRGYFVGTSDTMFSPNKEMTRSMFVAVLARLNGVDLAAYDGVTSYEDVKATSYFAKALDWATENDIVTGYSDTKFGPDDSITREQMCALIYRYCEYVGNDMTVYNPDFMNKYTDLSEISGWAKEAVVWTVSTGLIKGCTNTTVNPKGMATRAQVAQVIRNLCDKAIYQ